MKSTLLALLVVSSAAWAQEGKVWTGKVDDKWENPANWSPEGVPGRDSTLYLGPSKGPSPVLRRTTVLRRIIVDDDAILKIDGARTLYVTERLEVNGRLEFGDGAIEAERALVVGPKGRIQRGKDDQQTGKVTHAIWTGAVSDVWTTAANWSTGQVPTAHTNVTIPTVASGTYPVIATTANAHNLTVGSGAAITFTQGTSNVTNFTVEGRAVVDGGTVNIVGTLEPRAGSSVIVKNTGTITMTNGSPTWNTGTLTFTNSATGQVRAPEGNLGFTPSALEHRKVWRGKPDGDWFDPKNWESGEVPGAEDDVVLRSDPVLSKETAARSLAIEGSGLLILRAKLNVKSDLDVQGELVFEKGGELAFDGLLRMTGSCRVSRR